jgi:hypothetical protein
MPEPSDRRPPQSPQTDLTWPALLARWTAFAQSSLALPKTSDGDRWRSAVTSIINLQAVTFALGDLDRLAKPGERALALDKSDIIIRSSTGQLHALWRPDPLPAELVSLIQDAGLALEASRGAGVEWRVTAERLIAEHPGELVDRLLEVGFNGDLYIPTPGMTLFQNSPAAFARNADGSRPDEHALRAIKEFLVDVTRPESVSGFRQVYRQFDFAAGRAVRDLVAPAGEGAAPPPGQALLVPAIRGGRAIGVTLPQRKTADVPSIPLVFRDLWADAQEP